MIPDVVVSYDLVARFVLVLLALLWVGAMVQHVIEQRSRQRMTELLVILQVDASHAAEAFQRVADAARHLSDQLAKRRTIVGPMPPDSGTLRSSLGHRQPPPRRPRIDP